MIISTATRWLLVRFGLKGPEFFTLFVGILAIGMIAGFVRYTDNLKRDRIIAEEAVKASEALYRDEIKRTEVDTAAVVAWLEKRDEYRRQQNNVINTAYMEYFRFPSMLENVTLPTILTSGVLTPLEEETIDEPPTPSSSLSRRQRDAVTSGLWDSYCLAVENNDERC